MPEPVAYAPMSGSAAPAPPAPESAPYALAPEPPASGIPQRAPFPMIALAVAGIGAVAFGVVGFVVGRSGKAPVAPAPIASATVADAASAAPAPSAAPPPAKVAPPVPTTVLAKAAAGEHDALAELEARDPAARDVDEALAISAGHTSALRQEVEALGSLIQKDATKLSDHDVRDKLVRYARDGETYRDAQRVIAAIPGSDGPDLLYEVWTGTPRHTPATALAESLVFAKGVREHASPALSLALDLRAPASCDAAKKLVAAAADTGDRRSLHLLLRLESKRGCGAGKRDDCYPCLRADKHAITDAVKAVQKKPGPRF